MTDKEANDTDDGERQLPPKKRVIRLRKAIPPVKIAETRESRGEHGTALLLMTLVVALAVFETGPMAWMGMGAAVIWGYGLGMYIAYPKMYAEVND